MTALRLLGIFLHVIGGIAMIAGLVGRELVRAQARRATDIGTFVTLTGVAGRFERLLVIPGSLAVFVLGVATSWRGGWPLFGFLQGAASNWLLASLILYFAPYLLVAGVFLPRGKDFDRALTGAVAAGRITADLTAAFDDRLVRLAHYAEAIIIVLILYLMIVKPF